MCFSHCHTHTHVAAIPSNASLTSAPVCNVSPLSPTDTILQSSGLPASLNYSSNMPIWQSQPLCGFAEHYRQEKCVYLSPCVSPFHFLLLSFPLPLFLCLIFSRRRHIPVLFIGMRRHSDLPKWMWQAESLVRASYKSHTFASIEFISSLLLLRVVFNHEKVLLFFSCYNVYSLVLSLIIYANCSSGKKHRSLCFW